ncbi:Fungal specific transcription factor domain-containing protein [Cladophialophora immunda]|nr:Fungal specific transcription factor domain-containing protein [Cladophialophora immunda]
MDCSKTLQDSALAAETLKESRRRLLVASHFPSIQLGMDGFAYRNPRDDPSLLHAYGCAAFAPNPTADLMCFADITSTARRGRQPRPGSEPPLQPPQDGQRPRSHSVSANTSQESRNNARQERSKISLSFLLNYVNPTTTMADAYGPVTEKAGAGAPVSLNVCDTATASDFGTSAATVQLVTDEFISPFNSDRLDDFFVSCLFPDSEDFQGSSEDTNWSTNWQILDQSDAFDNSPAVEPFNCLIDSLTGFTLSLPQGHPESAPNDRLAKAATLFSRANVERFVGHYFRDYCPHSPILHPGTFRIAAASPFLLTVLVLTGALFSSSPNDMQLARDILGLVVEYAISNPVFRKLLHGPDAVKGLDEVESLQALQAAFFITQVRLREGSPSCRRDARKSHFEEIICAVRALGLLETRNSFFEAEPPPPEKFQWAQFAARESRIRLVCGIFNLDASFTILYNMTPRLFAEEMSIGLPGSVDAFFADNAQDCYRLSLKEHGLQKLRLSQICDAFLQDEWDEEMRCSMQHLSLLHLCSLMLALTQILWLSPYRPGKRQTMKRMKEALIRWKAVWDFQNATLTARQRDRYGFLKTIPLEFWQIATVLVEKNSTSLDTAITQNAIAALSNNQCAQTMLESVEKEQS